MSVDKRIDKIIKRYASELGYVGGLCYIFNSTEFRVIWLEFWIQINTKNKTIIPEYFDKHRTSDTFEAELLRLLVVEDFKLYLKQKGVK